MIDFFKLPVKWKLFLFSILIIIHFILLFSAFINLIYLFLLTVELLFFLYFSKISLKLLFRIFVICFLVFLSNVFYSDGKIIYEFYFINITDNGFLLAIKRCYIFLITFLFTYNTFSYNKDNILLSLKKTKFSLIIDSINYFFIFINSFKEKLNAKFFLKRIYKLYLADNLDKRSIINNKKELKLNFIFYQIIFFILFLILFLFSISNKIIFKLHN